MSTHQLREALELASDVALISRGSLAFRGARTQRNARRPRLALQELWRVKPGFLRQACAIAGKDLRSEWRTKESINASVSFAVVILLLFSFAFDPGTEQIQEISGGMLWLVFTFAGALILNRSFARELLNDCLEVAALLARNRRRAVPRQVLRVTSCCCWSSKLISLPVFGIFYNIDWTQRWPVLLVRLCCWAPGASPPSAPCSAP